MAKKIGEILVERGLLTPEILNEGLASQKFYGGRVGSLLVDMGAIDEKDLIETLCAQKHAKPAKAGLFKAVTQSTLDLIPKKVAVRYQAVPLARDNRRLTVAMADPNDLLGLDELAFITGCVIEPLLATERTILNALEKYYGYERKKREVVQVQGVKRMSGTTIAGTVPPADQPVHLHPTRPAGADTESLTLEDAAGADDEARQFWAGEQAPAAVERGTGAMAPLADARPSAPPVAAAPPAPPVAAALPATAVTAHPAAMARAGGRPGAPTTTDPLAAHAPGEATEEIADGNLMLVDDGDSTSLVRDSTRTMEEAPRRLAQADVRDDIADVIMWCTEELFVRSALFIFQKSRTLGWTGQGEGLEPRDVRRVVMPVEEVSVFTLVRDNPHHYLGILPDNAPNHRLIEAMGGQWPPGVLVIPFGVKGRALGCFYAEDEPAELEKIDLQLMFRLLQKAGLALEVLLLRTKLLLL